VEKTRELREVKLVDLPFLRNESRPFISISLSKQGRLSQPDFIRGILWLDIGVMNSSVILKLIIEGTKFFNNYTIHGQLVRAEVTLGTVIETKRGKVVERVL